METSTRRWKKQTSHVLHTTFLPEAILINSQTPSPGDQVCSKGKFKLKLYFCKNVTGCFCLSENIISKICSRFVSYCYNNTIYQGIPASVQIGHTGMSRFLRSAHRNMGDVNTGLFFSLNLVLSINVLFKKN